MGTQIIEQKPEKFVLFSKSREIMQERKCSKV